MRVVLLAALLIACIPRTNTSDLRSCSEDDPNVDCCTEAAQCLAYFGPEFPFCVDPGEQTGKCVECTVHEHCDEDSYCKDDEPDLGPYCAPLPPEER